MSGYVPRHAANPDPSQLPPAMRGLADKIQIVPSKEEQ